eukprot:2039018-Rhodomonas_salina.1
MGSTRDAAARYLNERLRAEHTDSLPQSAFQVAPILSATPYTLIRCGTDGADGGTTTGSTDVPCSSTRRDSETSVSTNHDAPMESMR